MLLRRSASFGAKTLPSLATLLLLGGLNSAFAAEPKVDASAVDVYLKSVMREYRIPACAVVIVQNGQVAFLRAYGEAAPGRVATPATPFYIGSLTKSFTALAVLSLVDRRLIELDAPVRKYLPWFAVSDPDAASQVTIRHLLNHTSGIPDSEGPAATQYAPTLEKQVRSLASRRPTSKPGTAFQYANDNYRTLGLVVETVTGRRFADYLRHVIFDPFGMTGATADPSSVADAAAGHIRFLGLSILRRQRFQPAALPSGYLMMSAEDLGKYLIALLEPEREPATRIARPETLGLAFSPPAGISSPYGMGWLVGKDPDYGHFLFHGGALEGFQAKALMVPSKKLGIGFLMNRSGVAPANLEGPRLLNAGPNGLGGLTDVLIGKRAQSGTPYPYDLVVIGLALVVLAYNAARFIGARRSVEKALARSPLRRFVFRTAWIALALGAAMLFGRGGWETAFVLVPDLSCVVAGAIALCIGRNVMLLAMIAHGRRGTQAW